MKIYDYETFEIKNLEDINFIQKKYPNGTVNFLHKYNSLVWQGPLYAQILNEILSKKNCNYIVELGNNIGLSLALIKLQIKVFAIDKSTMSKNFNGILSIAKKEKVKILLMNKLRVKEI